jgi:hypothetical protein
MYSRITDAYLKNDRIAEVRNVIDNDVLPTLHKQPGFVDAIEALDHSTGHFVCMTLWRTEEDANRYGSKVFPELTAKLEKFISKEPVVYTLKVETSTVHQIAKGQVAA